MAIRDSIAAGIFYPKNEYDLRNVVQEFLRNVPDEKIKGKIGEKIIGGIVPHAGYVYSGQTAAYVYNLLRQREKNVDVFVIFGANHTHYEKIVVCLGDFETPLGIVKNSKMTERIFREARGLSMNIIKDGASEHSIEVQLPFLQEIMKNKQFEIIPILVRDINIEECKKLAGIVYGLIKGRKIFVLASSDFTHYGQGYGFLDKNFKKYDKEAIEQIVVMNSEKFLEKAEGTTICGSTAIVCCIELCKLLGAEKGKLLDFTNSSKISGDKSQVVDYAGIVVS